MKNVCMSNCFPYCNMLSKRERDRDERERISVDLDFIVPLKTMFAYIYCSAIASDSAILFISALAILQNAILVFEVKYKNESIE